MNLPDTPYQLLVLLVLLMPGIVYAAARYQFRGPVPDEKETTVRMLRALMVSVLLDALYAVAVGPQLVALARTPATGTHPPGLAAHPRELATYVLVLIFVIPTAAAFLLHGLRWHRRDGSKLYEIHLNRSYRATPTAWDHAAPRRGGCFVRLLLKDGTWAGGYVGPQSYVSSWPEPADMFIDRQYRLDQSGQFGDEVEGTAGLYVPLTDVRLVEWQHGRRR